MKLIKMINSEDDRQEVISAFDSICERIKKYPAIASWKFQIQAPIKELFEMEETVNLWESILNGLGEWEWVKITRSPQIIELEFIPEDGKFDGLYMEWGE